MVEYKADPTKIAFNCLYNRLAYDHPTMDLSCYTLVELLKVFTLKDDTPSTCPPTPSPSNVHSSKTLPIILEDRYLRLLRQR